MTVWSRGKDHYRFSITSLLLESRCEDHVVRDATACSLKFSDYYVPKDYDILNPLSFRITFVLLDQRMNTAL